MVAPLDVGHRFQQASNLALNEVVARRRAAGEPLVHLGFGESLLPVPPAVRDWLADGAGRTAYGPVAGDTAVRAAVAGYWERRRLPTAPEQIIVAPGSKPLLMALMAVVDGDVLLPRPSWVTYAPQARLLGRPVHHVPISARYGGAPDPDALRETVRGARRRGGRPRLLILTLPDNPTGTLAPPEAIRRLCAVAADEDLLIVSDEIYRDLMHSPDLPFLGPAEVAGDRTVVTTGLSKTLGLGGWRIGAARFPEGPLGAGLRAGVLAVASEVWSTLAGPMQEVATRVFAEPPEITAHVRAGARLHGIVTRAVHRIVTAAGADCRAPDGGFYLYPDFAPVRHRLREHGVTDAESLQRHLLDRLGVAVLGGHHFGDTPTALRFRIATSLLHGDDDEQRGLALRSPAPERLPHVASALAHLTHAFGTLTAGEGTTPA
ncbi:pyridoxal phosphate-dependent aminotransferase [Streptomyces aurantiacus]|uniref:Aminotransferase n=1 Tax=Streptomyces aurantiacus JA 4570 TaxID=1286094 RepID=S3ZTD6_9ACTN|nr:pyridoxal phosphate-dependent aminotransferase [Streptomyces aurantiacus]EPH46681.1 putative Aspartate aminotransferase [Streptomyces aurantiacus JA 4570]